MVSFNLFYFFTLCKLLFFSGYANKSVGGYLLNGELFYRKSRLKLNLKRLYLYFVLLV